MNNEEPKTFPCPCPEYEQLEADREAATQGSMSVSEFQKLDASTQDKQNEQIGKLRQVARLAAEGS